jgi:hypothetical protein
MNREKELESKIDTMRTEHRKVQTDLAEKCADLETRILNDRLEYSRALDKLEFKVKDY